MMRNVSEEATSDTNESISVGNVRINFRTNPDFRTARLWQPLITENQPERPISTTVELRDHLENTIRSLINAGGIRHAAFDRFIADLNQQDPSLGYQGITIGGTEATDIHILRNRVEGFLQGIHIGLSHHDESRIDYDMIHSAKIEKNYVRNILPLLHTHGRHGIFIGNCHRLLIDKNELELQRMTRANNLNIDAIRIWGVLGNNGTITNNHIYSLQSELTYDTGIRVEPLETSRNRLFWNITWNSISARDNDLVLPANVFDKYFDTNS